MTVRYTRQFKFGDKGSDVQGVGRALARAKMLSWRTWIITPLRIRQTWGPRKQRALKRFKSTHGLLHDSRYTREAHAKLSPYFDAKAKQLMKDWHPPLSTADKHWKALMVQMQLLNKNTAGYVYGAGHGTRIDSQDPNDAFDCSSSTSYVTHKAGMFPPEYAWVSGEFARSYGVPGKGKYFTIYANGGHVWIRLHKSIYWRFDTSPYGDTKSPKSGPRLRFMPRLTWGFTARHWPGM